MHKGIKVNVMAGDRKRLAAIVANRTTHRSIICRTSLPTLEDSSRPAKRGTPLSLFHAGRHLRHRHQWLRHLIEQLASILLFSQRGHEELNQERLANLKR